MRAPANTGVTSLLQRRRSSSQNPSPAGTINRPPTSEGILRADIVASVQPPNMKSTPQSPALPPIVPKQQNASTPAFNLSPPPKKNSLPNSSGTAQSAVPLNSHPAVSNLSQAENSSPIGANLNKSITPSGNAGKAGSLSVYPTSSNFVANEFGLQPKQQHLTKVQAQKKNVSPFNSEMFLPMLRPCPKVKEGKITLILDIDETLVHASLKPRADLRYDTVVHINDGPNSGDIYVAFRPHLHTFLRAMAPLFEVVVFTASQSCYADPLMDTIDPSKVLVTDRLYREHCVEVQGGRIKDLNLLGRSMDRMLIIDNSPVAYCFQPRNAVPILSWFDDPNDDELLKLIPLLQQLATQESVYPFLDMYNAHLLSQDEVKCGSPATSLRNR